ncbi:hypothetical protein RIF29_39135 [Crotalaria pallida]|uniref:Uncharacterized protein n=1 Tax=Crotalaria pallida TaxID=3830 RepID=A0AAN9E606_CROPI
MDALAKHAQGEKHEKPSSEKDDQKARSNKKVKTGDDHEKDDEEMVISDQPEQSIYVEKPSFRDIVMAMEGYQPTPQEIIQMVKEDLCPMLDDEEKDNDLHDEFISKPKIEKDSCPEAKVLATNIVATEVPPVVGNIPAVEGKNDAVSGVAESVGCGSDIPADPIPEKTDSEFGPWMVVQRPQRRKFRKERGDENHVINAQDSNKFKALSIETHVDSVPVNSTRVENGSNVERVVRRSQKPNTQKSTKFGPPKPKSITPALRVNQNKPAPKVKPLLAAVKPPLLSEENDCLAWAMENNGEFSISSAVKLNQGLRECHNSPDHATSTLYRLVWRWPGPQRIRALLLFS